MEEDARLIAAAPVAGRERGKARSLPVVSPANVARPSRFAVAAERAEALPPRRSGGVHDGARRGSFGAGANDLNFPGRSGIIGRGVVDGVLSVSASRSGVSEFDSFNGAEGGLSWNTGIRGETGGSNAVQRSGSTWAARAAHHAAAKAAAASAAVHLSGARLMTRGWLRLADGGRAEGPRSD